jgi:DNA-binding response OmpR family regulator
VQILIVEDDERIRAFLERGLASQGHQVTTAEAGDDGLQLALDPGTELVILDLSLPALDGQDVLVSLRRSRPSLPVLVLTARDALEDKVRALDSGADDYLTKPFALDELLARVRALTRRSDQASASAIEIEGVRLDLHTRRVSRDGDAVDLSAREFALLEYLMRNAGRVLSRTQILAAVWEYDFDPQSNVVDVYVRYLRRKIDRPDEASLIEAVRGAGYRFRGPSEPASR